MSRKFNITGVCIPQKHYMVETNKKIDKIQSMVENGLYFTINRPRQFGKTTTLFNLSKALIPKPEYCCIEISFEGLGEESYSSNAVFIAKFINQIRKQLVLSKLNKHLDFLSQNLTVPDFEGLSQFITGFCSVDERKIVLLIDEVDKSMNNQLFLDFLGMLRNKYLERDMGRDITFHSVVLAGVHDVKGMKLKINPKTEFKYNSPWNIATDFKVDLSFNPEEIATMLVDYVQDKKVEMDIPAISQRIYHYTRGYPFLVSRICKEIDEMILPEKGVLVWDISDIEKAIRDIVFESNTNFDSLIRHIEDNKELSELIEKVLVGSEEFRFVINSPIINLGYMYGIFDYNKEKQLIIHNKIYEEVITDYLTSKMKERGGKDGISRDVVKSAYIKPDGRLSIEKVLLKFQETIKEKYSKSDVLKSDEFLEKDLRLLFLVYLKPIINGIGFCFKEVETGEEKRLDIVILFRDEKFIVELKLWRGNEHHQQGISQLKDYMHRESAGKGYMLIMDKTRHKEFTSYKEEEILMVWI